MTISRRSCNLVVPAMIFAAMPLLAHHSFAAEYDDKKPVTLKGTVSKFDWSNPHVYFFLDVTDASGKIVNWPIEWESRIELKRAGWTRDSLKVGDVVTVEGSLARDGSKQAGGKSITLASGKKLSSPNETRAAAPRSTQPAKPAPRGPDGHVRLGVGPGQLGYWANPSSPSLIENTAGNLRMNRDGILINIADAAKVAPFQPWAKGLYEYRQRNLLKDDPMASCLPPGGPRQFQAPYGIQILEDPDRKRMFVMSGGGNRNWRLIYLDGRAQPKIEDATSTYFGDSVGQWEGDTLVLNTLGFNDRFWFTNGGLPHTEALHLTERISRPDFNTLKYEVTVDDPGAYTRPWTGGWTLQWVPDQEIEEYFCDDYNRDEAGK
jgi:hypothetical protein